MFPANITLGTERAGAVTKNAGSANVNAGVVPDDSIVVTGNGRSALIGKVNSVTGNDAVAIDGMGNT